MSQNLECYNICQPGVFLTVQVFMWKHLPLPKFCMMLDQAKWTNYIRYSMNQLFTTIRDILFMVRKALAAFRHLCATSSLWTWPRIKANAASLSLSHSLQFTVSPFHSATCTEAMTFLHNVQKGSSVSGDMSVNILCFFPLSPSPENSSDDLAFASFSCKGGGGRKPWIVQGGHALCSSRKR